MRTSLAEVDDAQVRMADRVGPPFRDYQPIASDLGSITNVELLLDSRLSETQCSVVKVHDIGTSRRSLRGIPKKDVDGLHGKVLENSQLLHDYQLDSPSLQRNCILQIQL